MFVVPATSGEVERLESMATSDLGQRPMPTRTATIGPTVWITGHERHRWALEALLTWRRERTTP